MTTPWLAAGARRRVEAGAAEASRLAATKALGEEPVLEALLLDGFTADDLQAEDERLAAIRPEWSPLLAAESVDGISRHLAAGADVTSAIAAIERSLVADTALAEIVLRPRIGDWLAVGAPVTDLDASDRKIYEELLLTSLDDPWMGLFPGAGYTALTPIGGGPTLPSPLATLGSDGGPGTRRGAVY